jgi:hypothetical protein
MSFRNGHAEPAIRFGKTGNENCILAETAQTQFVSGGQ